MDRSRQSLRSFYPQFDGKHELLLALFEDALSRAADQIRAATSAKKDPLERLKVAVTLLFELPAGPDGTPAAVHRLRPAATDLAPQRGQGCARPLVALFCELMEDAAAAGRTAGRQSAAGWPR